jgi:hypothetical protein
LLESLVGALDGDEEGRIVLKLRWTSRWIRSKREGTILSVGVGDGVGPPVGTLEGNALGMSKGAGVPDPPVQKPQEEIHLDPGS